MTTTTQTHMTSAAMQSLDPSAVSALTSLKAACKACLCPFHLTTAKTPPASNGTTRASALPCRSRTSMRWYRA